MGTGTYVSQNGKKSILAQKSYGGWFYDIPYRTYCLSSFLDFIS